MISYIIVLSLTYHIGGAASKMLRIFISTLLSVQLKHTIMSHRVIYIYIYTYVCMYVCMYVCIYIYIYEKAPLWCPHFWHILCWERCSHQGHIHVFKFMRCFAMAKQHFQYAHVNQKKSMGNHKPWIKPKQPRFQNQWVAKTIENTNN